jgi:hypothetical protein
MKCPECDTDLPSSAAFCLKCGKPIEQDVDLRAPADIDSQWVRGVFESDGYTCTDSETDYHDFLATHPERMNLFVSYKDTVALLSMQSLWRMKQTRRNDPKVSAAINTFNSQSVIWWAYQMDPTSLVISTIFTLSARTSPRSLRAFLEESQRAFVFIAENSGLVQVMQ